MADVTKLSALLDAYGAAVRAGVITPCLSDENEFRVRFGLKPAGPEVEADWKKYGGIRRPVTLSNPTENSGKPTKPEDMPNE